MDELIEIATRILSQHWRDLSTNMALDRQRMLAGHVVPVIAAAALRDAADAWQWGEWSTITEPAKRPEQVPRILGIADAVTGWIRARADQIKREARNG